MPRSTVSPHRRTIALAAAAALTLSMATTPASASAPTTRAANAPIAALAAPSGPTAALVGSLQSELGCSSDWQPECAATDLALAADGLYRATFTLPAGSYEYKVALNDTWDESYGAGGKADGGNIPLVLQAPLDIAVTYDNTSHLITISPAKAQPGLNSGDRTLAGTSLREDLTREQFYFVMADRFANGSTANDQGGYGSDRLESGFDPSDKGFYHGGDIVGITEKLDYLKGLGITSVWMTPSFKNRPVQGSGADVSAGYHGYWITDFTQIDPHLGTNDELRALIDAAHAKGIKVFFDIITNHTADVIDNTDGEYGYVTKDAEPYRDAAGNTFDDKQFAAGDTFPELDAATSFPRPPTFLTEADKTVKVPAWLNDPTNYHNRGNAAFDGSEGDLYGDFSGLDDLFTEKPAVREGMIDVYKYWAEFGIDGFRIDTVKHVNMEFWQDFSPEILGAAAAAGVDDFFMFGEVYDSNPAAMSQFTTEGGLQATIDFGFQSRATGFGQGRATTEIRDLFAADDYYIDTDSNAYSLPTFLGNHDMGRVGKFLADSGATGDELLARDELTHSLMYLTRGQPVVYYGDEQGFTGDGGDKDARQDMFPSQVASYNDDDLIGTDATTAVSNFDQNHPLYQHISAMAKLRKDNPALADGAQIHRYASEDAGLYAFSRVDAGQQIEYVVAANNSTEPKTATFDTFDGRELFRGIYPAGTGSMRADAEGRVTVTVPPLSVSVWKSATKLERSHRAPQMVFASPSAGGTVANRAEVSVAVPQGGFNQVTLAWRPAGTTQWTVLGTDDNAPYRVFHDVSDLPKGTLIEYRAVLKDNSGNLSVATSSATVGDPAPPAPGGGTSDVPTGPVDQPTMVTVPGDLSSEMGCPGDWQPECAAGALTLDSSGQTWTGRFNLPAGTYQYKAAINGSWAENYGAKGQRDGSNIPLVLAQDSTVSFYYDHVTHWATTNIDGPIITAAGSFQSEIGCPNDWAPECLGAWLKDPDGDGTYTYATTAIPAGSYEAKATHGLSWDENYGEGGAPGGANIAFTVAADGAVTVFRYDIATHVLTIGAPGVSAAGDLNAQQAQWISAGTIAWDLPAAANGWHYRLHYAAQGGLGLEAETVTGGSSIPLTWGAGGLSAAERAKFPHLAAYDALKLPTWVLRDRNLLERILSGQIAIAAYDDLGRLMNATGVQIPGVLDDLYRGALDEELGPVFDRGRVTLSVWAPTAQDVDLLIDPAGSAPERTVQMKRDRDGIWSASGGKDWNGAAYAFQVKVYVPATGKVETNIVTDPYSLGLTTNSKRSLVVDLSSAYLKPVGWDKLRKPGLARPEDTTAYELHIRDFSIGDETVPAANRGKYLAFTNSGSDGMKHLSALAKSGLNTLQLLPAFDLATVNEDPTQQKTPACDLVALTAANPAGEEQQACVMATAGEDGFNWGYDPYHYTVPEGSYSSDANGTARTKEFRQMVSSVNSAGLRVVMDVVYNHTTASGQSERSVLDRVVPGYYQRLSASGAQETSTCCANTASEHAMMEKLIVDSVRTWAVDYKVDGFRFDLMAHHSRSTMEKVRAELDSLTVKRDGVDGKSIYVYGEGWNFGEVADNARFVQASQQEMYGAGIGTFNDRLRDGVRGGGPFDEDPRVQGFGSGLYTDPNAKAENAGADALAGLLNDQNLIEIGLTGNLRHYVLYKDANGNPVTGADIDYNGSPAGYTADPSEIITYVDAHDNETLFDSLTFKLPVSTSMADRVRMNTLSLSTTALGQGPLMWHAGVDLLRSKSLDRNSYDSGDWFNRIDFAGKESTFGSGLPPKTDNEAKWSYMSPLLANAALKPGAADMASATAGAQDLLKLRFSSPLFRLGSASEIGKRVSFPLTGPKAVPGVIVMEIDDRAGIDLDPKRERIVVVFNASPTAQTVPVALAGGLKLHPVQAAGSDPIVKGTTVSGSSVTVPARTVAVLQG